VALLRRAVALLNDRAARLAASGRRVHEPTPADPAIVVIIDEYAELPAEAQDLADSIGRRGRAVAVTLIMATQRPTQAAMGGGAVRSQADVRICLRVRERGDVNLILGQGAVAAGWDASILTLPGTFLIASPAHTMAQRARARLITDEQVAAHAARYATPRAGADGWPGGPDAGAEPAGPSARATAAPGTDLEPAAPDAALWDALSAAGPDGAAIADLMAATGMGRSWVYYRLAGYARAGRAVQTVRGSWRAVPAGGDPQ
jgi:S-DNA-T family DNA segregation ATPase FtsK/SpoIIIE